MASHEILSKIGLYLKKSSPTILACLSIVGVVTTTFLTAKATAKAVRQLDKVNQPTTVADKIFITWDYYIPPVLTGAATISCILGAHVLNKRQQVSLISAYTMASQAYTNYRNTLIELHGEELDKEVREEMVRGVCNYHPINVDTPDQKVIFYEETSGQSIERYEREIIDAEYHFNRNFSLRSYAFLNEFYQLLGIEPNNQGQVLGWSMASGLSWVDFEHRLLGKNDDGIPIYAIDMVYPPDILEWWEC